MPLTAFEDFDADPLAFPIRGKLYTLPLVGMADGLRLEAAIAGSDETLAGEPPEVLWRMVMGSLWDEMLADNVPLEAVTRAALSALADFQYGRAAAVHVWESGISPEALAAPKAANREQRRAGKKAAKKATPSTGTAAGARTRTRASGSGTRTSPQN